MIEDATGRLFLDFSCGKLQQLSSRLDTCLAQLSQEQVWARSGKHENAVGNLVLHLCGNVHQWIIASIGGEPDTRHRDDEFSTIGGITTEELRDRLSATITRAIALIGDLSTRRLSNRMLIQGYDVSVLDAIYHVVEHFAMHAGQIIFITKRLTGRALHFKRDLESVIRYRRQTP